MATASGKVGMKETNSYHQGKTSAAKSKVTRCSTGAVPNKGGNGTKSGGINRATKGR